MENKKEDGNLDNLTAGEIDILVEALGEWENKGLMGLMMGGLLDAIVSKADRSQTEVEAKQKEAFDKHEREARSRKEASILLKAKLITFKNRIDADRLTQRP